MKTLVWSATFVRAFKRSTKRDPALKERAADILRQLAEDPFYHTLHSHKLKGELSGVWACTVDFDNRILFEFAKKPNANEEEIFLLTMGTHYEVY
ncbi:MAG: type II toxin-antitoxin system mRNA interferase toxin, RelE/StbE family [Gallionella sp.]|nr:type II toxin-antitoxin system mRNA interferase toxin, RelE/StbE family [Gallionella sp.]